MQRGGKQEKHMDEGHIMMKDRITKWRFCIIVSKNVLFYHQGYKDKNSNAFKSFPLMTLDFRP